MIDQGKLQALKGEARIGEAGTLQTLTHDEMLALKELLDSSTVEKSLKDLNLEHELLAQYARVKRLQEEVLNDDSVPANQRAQVAGAVASTLQQLIKMQVEFSTSERFKAIEALMIKAMRKLPKDVAEEFLEEYERLEV